MALSNIGGWLRLSATTPTTSALSTLTGRPTPTPPTVPVALPPAICYCVFLKLNNLLSQHIIRLIKKYLKYLTRRGAMSVLKSRRNLSELEFFHNAVKLRRDIVAYLLRDFGIRDKVRKVKDDKGKELTVIEEYPNWLIENIRNNILTLSNLLVSYITTANSIYPANEHELTMRRWYQTVSITVCERLIQEIEFCVDTLPVKGKFALQFVDKITFEIMLLKSWRKANNRLFRNIINKNQTPPKQ
jgi:hypothetical protein